MVPAAVAFNGERALDHVKKQMEIGPRVSGSPELAMMRDYIVSSLKKSGLGVRQDEFTATTPLGEKKMVNLTAEIPGESKDVVIIRQSLRFEVLQGHAICRRERSGRVRRHVAGVGASPGREAQEPKLTYWLVFFDGEEAFCEGWDQCHNPNPADPAIAIAGQHLRQSSLCFATAKRARS